MDPRRALAERWYSPERVNALATAPTVEARAVMAARMLPLEARAIVDLGCGTGSFGRLLDTKRQVKPLGVEWVQAAAELARPHYRDVLTLDMEAADWPFEPGSLDAVIALDLFEQVIDPAGLLQRVRPLLKPTGVLIGSFRNARSAEMVRQLLLNSRHWPAGDAIPPRFGPAFTLRDFADLLAAQGYWFERPVIGTHRDLPADLQPLAGFLADQGLDDSQVRSELGTEEYVFLAAPTDRPSGRLMVNQIPAITVTWDEAMGELD